MKHFLEHRPEVRSFNGTLERMAQEGIKTLYPQKTRISVGLATCGRSAGAQEVFNTLVEGTRDARDRIDVVPVGCFGQCWAEPLVSVHVPQKPRAVYRNMTPGLAAALVDAAVRGNEQTHLDDVLLGYIAADSHSLSNSFLPLCSPDEMQDKQDLFSLEYLAAQQRSLMSSFGLIDPRSLSEYLAVGGYRTLQHTLTTLKPSEVIDIVESSRLRGRGGAGFLTARKWREVASANKSERYLIINADEGDPGAYMDRSLLESDPHRIIEGLALCAYAIDAHHAYVFMRSEYQSAQETLQHALDVAKEAGIIGSNMLGLNFELNVSVVTSAGAFICGEETAMIAALEGFSCEARVRPPYPSKQGLYGYPTCVNNVETLANIPGILLRDQEMLELRGTAENAGTKLFTLAGDVKRTGTVELALGTSIKTLVETIGGTKDAAAIQIGGPTGAFLDPHAEEVAQAAINFDDLKDLGGVMGSGGIVVLGENRCIVDTVLYCIEFAAEETCGKCTPCRESLVELLGIMKNLTAGKGDDASLKRLISISYYMKASSLCSFGRMVPDLLLSALRYFRTEFEEHLNGRCASLVCRDLIRFEINKDVCQGERCCLQACPGNAIKGSFGKPGFIAQHLCQKCWICTTRCPYNAIYVVSGTGNRVS